MVNCCEAKWNKYFHIFVSLLWMPTASKQSEATTKDTLFVHLGEGEYINQKLELFLFNIPKHYPPIYTANFVEVTYQWNISRPYCHNGLTFLTLSTLQFRAVVLCQCHIPLNVTLLFRVPITVFVKRTTLITILDYTDVFIIIRIIMTIMTIYEDFFW